MYILSAYVEATECDKAVKGADYIHCYQDGKVIAKFNGITDFSGYALINVDGSPAEFSASELDEITQLQFAIAELYEEVLANG